MQDTIRNNRGAKASTLLAGIILVAVLSVGPASHAASFENSPIGFASVNALGQAGTTGGQGGATVTVNNQSSLTSAIQRSGRLIVQFSGTISFSGTLNVASDKSIIGVGPNAVISGGGLQMSGTHNIIVRNIRFINASVNSITITEKAHHVWVDHCDFSNAGDTLMDIKRASSYVTVSWSHFTNTLETILQGHSDSFTGDIGNLRVTYHHNWFDGTQTRHPRVRFAEPVHVFNNYYLNISGYGVASTMNAGVLVEGNFFRNVPVTTKTIEGSSKAGRLVERNDTFVNSGAPGTRGTVVEPRTFYSYTLDPSANVAAIVTAGAGVGKI